MQISGETTCPSAANHCRQKPKMSNEGVVISHVSMTLCSYSSRTRRLVSCKIASHRKLPQAPPTLSYHSRCNSRNLMKITPWQGRWERLVKWFPGKTGAMAPFQCCPKPDGWPWRFGASAQDCDRIQTDLRQSEWSWEELIICDSVRPRLEEQYARQYEAPNASQYHAGGSCEWDGGAWRPRDPRTDLHQDRFAEFLPVDDFDGHFFAGHAIHSQLDQPWKETKARLWIRNEGTWIQMGGMEKISHSICKGNTMPQWDGHADILTEINARIKPRTYMPWSSSGSE